MPVFADYPFSDRLRNVQAIGFPQGRIDPRKLTREYSVHGDLRIASANAPFAWDVPPASKPDLRCHWEGMSGAAACIVGPNGALHVFGAVQQVPANFSSGQLEVARLSEAFEDASFLRHLRRAVGDEPRLVTYVPGRNAEDVSDVLAFDAQMRAFRDEYFVSETHPIPFGGRDCELRRLDAWLSDAIHAPRLLLTGPAGRGKSALLLHWIDRLRESHVIGDGGWRHAFLPISIRVGTHRPEVFLAALGRRLSEISGEDFAGRADADPQKGVYALRDLFDRIVRGDRRILVVIDGIDEAIGGGFDPAMLPVRLRPNLRILLSARWLAGDSNSRGWASRLGWDRGVAFEPFDLDRLETLDVRDVLAKLGPPGETLAGDRALIERLVALSEGEPLLIRFYCEDLWPLIESGTRVTLKDLEGLEPGFNNYFRRWFKRQEKAWPEGDGVIGELEIDAVLSTLAFALGPLEERELLSFLKDFHDMKRALAGDRLLRPLRRFVFGNGKRGSGYALSHPRIGLYLQEERFAGSVDDIRRRFVAWARAHLRDLNAGHIQPEEARPYVLQYLSAHLRETRAAPQAFLEMVADGWRRAWETFEGSQSGFARDARAAEDALMAHGATESHLREPHVGLGGLVKCALCLSSIGTISITVPADLLALCLQYKVIGPRQALSYLWLSPLNKVRAEAFGTLASYLSFEEVATHAPGFCASLPVEEKNRFISHLAFNLPLAFKPALLTFLNVAETDDLRATLIVMCAECVTDQNKDDVLRVASGIVDARDCWFTFRSLALDFRPRSFGTKTASETSLCCSRTFGGGGAERSANRGAGESAQAHKGGTTQDCS